MPKRVLFILLAAILIINGCGAIQIEDRAFVTAIGLDVVGTGEDAKYVVTIEVFRPGSMQSRSGNQASILQTVEAEDFETAFEQLQARLARVVTLSHLKIVVIGEEAAREIDFREIIDYFERHPEVQMRVRLMAVQGNEALELLKVKPLFNDYLSEELIALARKGDYLSLTNTNPFFEFVQDLRATGGRGLLPRIIMTTDGSLAILHGGAVYNNYKLAGWLSSEEVHAANFVVGGVQRSTVEGKIEKNAFTYSIRRSKVRIIPKVEQQQLGFTVKIQTSGVLRQLQGSQQLDMSDPNNVKKIEDAVTKKISSEAKKAVAKAQQEFGIDYLGFGTTLKRHNPGLYEQMQWEEAFPTVPIETKTETRITLTGKKW